MTVVEARIAYCTMECVRLLVRFAGSFFYVAKAAAPLEALLWGGLIQSRLWVPQLLAPLEVLRPRQVGGKAKQG